MDPPDTAHRAAFWSVAGPGPAFAVRGGCSQLCTFTSLPEKSEEKGEYRETGANISFKGLAAGGNGW